MSFRQQLARSHSGPLTRQPDPDDVRIRTSLENIRSKLDYHDRLREEHLEEKASIMKHHNDLVSKTKTEYEELSVKLRHERF